MADMQALNIVIGANTTAADQGLQKVSKELENTAKSAQKVDQSIGKTTTNFTGLNRVIQDLPFGFIAIQNNLEQIFPAAGLLGLAFSALVASITFAQVGLSNWTRGLGQSKEEVDEFHKALTQATQGAISIGVRLQEFVAIARDNTKSLGERNFALKEANKLMGEHGEKLTLVNINTKDVTEQINKFTEALINQAVAAKYADKVADLIIKQKDAAKAYGGSVKDLAKTVEETKTSINPFAGANLTKDYYDNIKAAITYKNITKDLHDTSDEFHKVQEEVAAAFGKIGGKAGDAAKGMKEFHFFTFDPNIVHSDVQKQIEPLTDHLHEEVQKMIDRKPVTIAVAPPPHDELDKIKSDTEAIIKDTLEGSAFAVGEGIGKLLLGMKNPFGALFDVIGAGLKALGKQMIGLSQIGKLIKLSLSELILNPALALAAGIAAVALGTVISNIGQGGLKGFATGGVVTRPTLALIGEAGPEQITPLNRISNAGNNVMQGEVVFNISGQNLRGILRRADQTAYNTF